MAGSFPDALLVSAAASVVLEELELDAADLFARRLSGDWGEVSDEVLWMNERPASERKLSCYWHDRQAGLGLVVVEEDDQLALITTTELTVAAPGSAPYVPSGRQ